MINYEQVLDPSTDLDAGFDNNSRCMVAMISHTAPRSWARVTTGATTAATALVAHDAMWGNSLGVAPVQARASLGTFTLTYPTSVNDELAAPYGPNAHTVNFRWATANHQSLTAFFLVQAKRTAANVITFTVRDSTFALVDTAVDVDVIGY
jgi:hypothetical protein